MMATPSIHPAQATETPERRPLMAAPHLLIALLMVGIPINLLRLLMQKLDATILSPAAVSHIGRNIVFAIATIATVGLAYAFYVRLVEKRRVTELGQTNAVRDVGIGVLLGTVLFSTTISLLALFGDYRVTGVSAWTVTIAPIFTFAAGAFVEEVLVRGIIFRILEEGLGTWIALALSAILFGAAHAMNPNATFVSSAAIALEAGILLGAAFMLTRSLWFAIGLHFAWNFTQGAIFGAAVSGTQGNGLLQSRLQGSPLISGGAFGPEASLIAVLVCMIAAGAVLYLAVRRGQVILAPWQQEQDA
jgi:uncharacterized protein